MKASAALFLVGAMLLVWGAALRDRPRLARALEQRLERELSVARSRGHGARVLVGSGDYRALAGEARALARSSSETVLALSPYAAVVIPSSSDERLNAARSWKRAEAVAERFLRNDDLNGAAATLVRAHSMALAGQGVVPDAPPLPPIFMPDVAPAPPRPSRYGFAGLGLVLLVLGAATACDALAVRRRSGRAATR